MTRYYCPDHPDQLLLDTEEEFAKRRARAEAWVLPEILICPEDDKSYFRDECTRKEDELG